MTALKYLATAGAALAAFATVAVPLASAQAYYPYTGSAPTYYQQGFTPAGHISYQNGTAYWTSSNTYSYTTAYTGSYPTYSNQYSYQPYQNQYSYQNYNSYPNYSYQYNYQYSYPQNNYGYNNYHNSYGNYGYGQTCYSNINGGPVFNVNGRFVYDQSGIAHWVTEGGC